MHSNRTPSRRIIVLADRDVTALDAHQLEALKNAVADAHVMVVAPARPVAGERWIVDLTARRARAEERLNGWATMLERQVLELELEVGDQSPRRALSDARRAFRPDDVIALAPLAEPSVRSGRRPSPVPRRSRLPRAARTPAIAV